MTEADEQAAGHGGWAVQVPRRMRSYAVLVGTATHVNPSGLTPIPQAATDVTALAEALTGPLGICDPSMVRARVDPRSPAEVLDLVPASGGSERPDLCLFYYAGHGLLAEGDQLCLALPGSVDQPWRAARTSLPVDDVFRAMARSAARTRSPSSTAASPAGPSTRRRRWTSTC